MFGFLRKDTLNALNTSVKIIFVDRCASKETKVNVFPGNDSWQGENDNDCKIACLFQQCTTSFCHLLV